MNSIRVYTVSKSSLPITQEEREEWGHSEQ